MAEPMLGGLADCSKVRDSQSTPYRVKRVSNLQGEGGRYGRRPGAVASFVVGRRRLGLYVECQGSVQED